MDEILLESGTNEVEILEFYMGSQSYGINVAKVLQIELYNPKMVTRTPGSEEGILGVYLWRGETVLLLDLCEIIQSDSEEEVERPIVLITEFNRIKNAFMVDGVNQVYRVGWERLEPISTFLGSYSSRTNATLHVKNTAEHSDEEIEILMLDFEAIVGDYCPESSLGYGNPDMPEVAEPLKREQIKIVLAEDSAFLRNIMIKTLKEAHFQQIEVFENGQLAFDYISELQAKAKKQDAQISDLLDIIITDIEMPLMDGLTLCRRVKFELGLKEIPVVFFSSLINEQMKIKCQEVGGDAQITKPEIGGLVSIVDNLCLNRESAPA